MTDLADPDFITGVVLLTDGYNDPADPEGLAELIDGSSLLHRPEAGLAGIRRAHLLGRLR